MGERRQIYPRPKKDKSGRRWKLEATYQFGTTPYYFRTRLGVYLYVPFLWCVDYYRVQNIYLTDQWPAVKQ